MIDILGEIKNNGDFPLIISERYLFLQAKF